MSLDFKLQDKQEVAFLSPATEICYGGAAGGGKSHLMRVCAIYWCLRIPNFQAYFFRRHYEDLVKNHMGGPNGFRMMLAPLVESGDVTIVEKEIRFNKNNSKIFLCHCNDEDDVFQYWGAEIHALFPDELTHFTERMYRFLRSRCRAVGLQVPEDLKGKFPCILAGTNPGNIGHCVPFGEVLTPAGWKDIRDIRVGDTVYSVGSDFRIVEDLVDQTHESEFSGELFSFSGGSLKILCTQNHKIGILSDSKKTRNKEFRLREAAKLPRSSVVLRSLDWRGISCEKLSVPIIPLTRKPKLNQPTTISASDFLALLGWVLAEGTTTDKKYGPRVSIAQSKPRTRAVIRELLTRIGVSFKEDKASFNFYCPHWHDFFRRLGKCREKFIPRWVLELDRELLTSLFTAMVGGDGHWVRYGISGQFYTISKQLADDFSELAVKCGYITDLKERQRKNRIGLSYEVFFKKCSYRGTELLTENSLYKTKKRRKRLARSGLVSYSGRVYCIGVRENHNFIIRQNGSIWVSGNSWVKSTFIDPAEPLAIWRAPKEDGGMLRQFIPARLEDNPALVNEDPEYENKLHGLGSPAYVKAIRYGSWEIFEGAFFTDFERRKHVVQNFTPPLHWKRFRSFDWGYAKPFCVHWWAISDGDTVTLPDGTEKTFPRNAIICYREWYGMQTTNVGLRLSPEAIAAGIKEREKGEKFVYSVADPSIFKEDGGPSIGERLGVYGVVFRPGDNKRIGGWSEVRARLSANPPMIYFTQNCLSLIRTMPIMQHDDVRAEDLDTDHEDHAVDSCRYACTSRPFTPKKPKKTQRERFTLDELVKFDKQWKRRDFRKKLNCY